jgi:endoribonuclease Dicer
MREYFQVPSDERPKVFGMTASPIWNPRDSAGSLATLEKSLDAKIVAVHANHVELASHTPKPEEVSILALLAK